ncbi:ankyrin repeat-containing domain protein [Aspergillus unguis]
MSFGFGVGDFLAVLKIANEARKRFVDAPKQLVAVADDVKRLSNVLRDIDDSDPAASLSAQQQTTLNEISQGCQDVLQNLINTLAKYQDFVPPHDGRDTNSNENGDRQAHRGLRRAGKRVWGRLTFDQSEIDSFRRRIDSNVNAFELFLADVNRSATLIPILYILVANGLYSQLTQQTKDIAITTQAGVTQLLTTQDSKHRQDILTWLSPTTHADKQVDIHSRVQPGTGTWLLESEIYKKWLTQNENTAQGKRTLFCPGLPGAGKTFLASIVINEIQRCVQEGSGALAFFYCNFRENTSLLGIFGALLRQFVQKLPVIPEKLETIYKQHLGAGAAITVNECLDLLASVLAVFPRSFIVLDALDECQVPVVQRKRLLDELFRLQKVRNLGLFATARDNPDVTALFGGKLSLRIRATAPDVERFLKGHLASLPRVVQQREDLQKEVIAAITESMDGMFLLARLHIDSIQGKRSVKQIRESLKTLPTGLDAAYSEAWTRIGAQLPDEVQTAKDVISWICCATRSLDTRELQHALAIEDGQTYLDEDNVPEIEDVIAVCGGLVTVDEEQNVVRLVHYTAQEYFERYQEKIIPGAKDEIARKCIYYLSLDAFGSGLAPTFQEYSARLEDFPLFEYAGENWGYHVRQTDSEVESDLVMELLRKTGNVNACFQVIITGPQPYYTDEQWHELTGDFQAVRGVHLAACAGLVQATSTMITEDEGGNVNAMTEQGHTPLWLASSYGFPDLVQTLLDQGAFIEARETLEGRTPLHVAVEENCQEVFTILANAGADIEGLTKSNNTPLGIASECGHETMTKLLLERGANPYHFICRDMMPLRCAAIGGHSAIFKLLLEAVGPKYVAQNYSRILYDAADGGEVDMVNLLLNQSLPDDLKTAAAQLALAPAVGLGRERVVRILLTVEGVDVEAKYIEGQPLISLAAGAVFKSAAVVELLLETYNANPNVRDEAGRTALSHAALFAHRLCDCEGIHQKDIHQTVKLLLDANDVDVNSQDKDGRTALHHAISSCFHVRPSAEHKRISESLAQILLDKGAAVDIKDNQGRTPTFLAAQLHLGSTVEMLLVHGAETDSPDDMGRTPLSYALDPQLVFEEAPKLFGELRHTVEVLLSHGASPTREDKEGKTPRSRAEEHLPQGHEILALLTK